MLDVPVGDSRIPEKRFQGALHKFLYSPIELRPGITTKDGYETTAEHEGASLSHNSARFRGGEKKTLLQLEAGLL